LFFFSGAGLDVLVVERSSWVGGAATTAELVPGFKFSRASYLAGLFRPQILEELELAKHGFKYLPRNPSSFTPGQRGGPYAGQSLMFWEESDKTHASIAQFSRVCA
jgi:phytoene dehydrogenase-like protein